LQKHYAIAAALAASPAAHALTVSVQAPLDFSGVSTYAQLQDNPIGLASWLSFLLSEEDNSDYHYRGKGF
jgi:hypothetical protein